MKRVVLLIAVCLISGTLYAANSPFVGQWKLDPSRTRLIDVMKVEHVSGDTYAFDFGGGAETIAVNGKDQLGGGGTTLAVMAKGPESWKVVRKKDGRIVITAIWRLSKDGKTLTDAFTQIGSRGSASTINYVYQRTAGDSGFAGTWKSTSMSTNSALLLTIQPYEKDGLSFIDAWQEVTKNLNFDGREYPMIGPNVPPGLAASARRIDEHALEITFAFKGRTVATEQVQLSVDGKKLTLTVRTPGGREPNIYVYKRQ